MRPFGAASGEGFYSSNYAVSLLGKFSMMLGVSMALNYKTTEFLTRSDSQKILC